MKKITFTAMVLLAVAGIQTSAQTTTTQKPVKTGNEWKMPADVFKRSKAFANDLQKKLGLDAMQTKKVYDAYLANTKPLDEIAILAVSAKEKESKVKANEAAFDETLKAILTGPQYNSYVKTKAAKNK